MVSFGNVNEPIPLEDQYVMLLEYAQRYQQENPNMAVVRMDFHADEFYRNSDDEPWQRSTPHLHIEDVPVATGYKQGLSVQSAFGKALKNMGYHQTTAQVFDEDGEPKLDETTGKPVFRTVTESEVWENRQREILEEIALEHGYTLKHPYKGKNVDSLTAQQYADLEQAKMHLEEREDTVQEREWAANAKERNIERDKRKLLEEEIANEIAMNEREYAVESVSLVLQEEKSQFEDYKLTEQKKLQEEKSQFEDYKLAEQKKLQEEKSQIKPLYDKCVNMFNRLTEQSDIFLDKFGHSYGTELGSIKRDMEMGF